ncbi:putative 26S proteasome regulatory subunit, variant 3 [Orbilia ellipsospora]
MKVLMAEIERALHSYHAEQAGAPEPTGSEDPATASSGPSAPRPETIVEAVFAVVNQVFPSSPAEAAGLKAGDKIKRFGTVGALNHEKLAKVATEVQQNENRAISVLVSRADASGEKDLDLSLTPRRDWGGRGMLGCHLLQL